MNNDPPRDDGHPALGSGSAIARGTAPGFSAAIAAAPDAAVPHRESGAPSGLTRLSAVLQGAGVPDHTSVAIATGQVATANPQRDAQEQASTEEFLQTLWGPDKVRENVARVNTYLEARVGAEAADLLTRGRNPETGGLYGNDPALLVRLADAAKAPQPEAMTIEALEKFMRTNRTAWNRDEALQVEYRRLLNARLNTKGN